MYRFVRSSLCLSVCLPACLSSSQRLNISYCKQTFTTTESYLDHNDAHDQSQQMIKVQYVNVNGLPVLVQFTYVGPPKILPIATADSYPEGSSINLICTVSGGQRRGLTLSWTLNGDDISEANRRSDLFDNVAINTDDADISILKIKNATLKNSGQYTCTAKNPLGQDSTSVKIVINGKCVSGCA